MNLQKIFLTIIVACILLPIYAQKNWKPYPEKVDMLAVIAHPDDEGYWGGMLAYYATCEQKKIILISLTSGEWGNGLPHPVAEGEPVDCSYNDEEVPCCDAIPEEDLIYPNYYREIELGNAARTYGIQYKPVTDRLFKDKDGIQPWGEASGGFEYWGGEDKVIGYITKQIRRFKPDVLVTLGWNGGNGNPQHAAAARGAIFAARKAGDKKNFPDQLTNLEVWNTKKVYMYVPEEKMDQQDKLLIHSWILTCTGNSKVTAQELGARGLAQHYCQNVPESCAESTAFKLVDSRVGSDTENKNFFEHLD